MLSLIVAIATNGIIGNDGHLPWRIPDDLKRFRQLTTGHAVIMGRLTYQEIGKPLPNRRNILVSRSLRVEGMETAASLTEALDLCGHDGFVIGGARLFAEALGVADRLYLTEVHRDYEGDVSFPPFDRDLWREVAREDRPDFDPPFSFVTLDRKPAIIA